MDKSRRRGQELKSKRRPALNNWVNQAAKAAGLNADQKRSLHDYLHSLNNDNLTYSDILTYARSFK